MHPIAIVVPFFILLVAIITATAFAQKKSARVISALATLGWACLMFAAASSVESLAFNIHYSNAAYKMLNAYIGGLEQGRQDAVLREMRRMTNELVVSYERKGNFKELAERAASSLVTTNTERAVSPSGP